MGRKHGKSSHRSWNTSGQSWNGRGGDRRRDPPGDGLLAALAAQPGSVTASQLAEALGEDPRAVGAALKRLVEQAKVLEVRPGRYEPSGRGGIDAAVLVQEPEGVFARLPDGVLRPVNPAYRIGAKPGDVVQVATGEDGLALVTRILRRSGREVVGTMMFDPGQTWLVCDNRREGRLPVRSLFPGFDEQYQAGMRVVGTIETEEDGQAWVRLTRMLGSQTPEIADFTYVVSAHDLPGEFPEEVEANAKAFPGRFPKLKRVDLTKELVFTIDPATAKDFDDAISLARDDHGRWVVGVHIADVSHYVRPGTPLDDEAAARGTSVYLINRVIPMLPEALSNGLCSLVPKQRRYCLSAFLTLDQRHELVDVRLAESVIDSRHRLTYEEALAILEDKDPTGAWPADLRETVQRVGGIAQALRRKREQAGAINLFSVEHRWKLDVEGNPVEAEREGSDISHQLIEECMLLANRAVARWLADRDLPCTYRTHEKPDEEKLKIFARILEAYGKDSSGLENRFTLQRILRNLEQEPPAARLVLNHLLLRCFKKAVYSIDNIGHYALAFEHYCHFTSPIRRYPDLLVHRLVKLALKLPAYRKTECRRNYLDALAKQSSWLEQRAEQAERDLHARKACRFLSARIGEEFPGVVLGAMGGGLFVQLLETGMEGVLPIRELDDDFYQFDPDRLSLVGSNSGRVIGPGEELDVIINHVDIERADVVLGLVQGRSHGRSDPARQPRRGDRDRGRDRDRDRDRDQRRRDPAPSRPARRDDHPAPAPAPAPARTKAQRRDDRDIGPVPAPAPARTKAQRRDDRDIGPVPTPAPAAQGDTRRLPRKLIERWDREDAAGARRKRKQDKAKTKRRR